MQSVGQYCVSEQQPDEAVTSDECVHPAASISSAASAAARSTQVEVPICSPISAEGSCLCLASSKVKGVSVRSGQFFTHDLSPHDTAAILAAADAKFSTCSLDVLI